MEWLTNLNTKCEMFKTVLLRVCAPPILSVLLLAGCATAPQVASTVTVFHTLQSATAGTTFAFVPLEGQESDLEYQTYQNYIRAHLVADGWVEGAGGIVQ